MRQDPLTGAIIDAAMRVHTALGPGLLESAYEACLAHALRRRGHTVLRQVPMPVTFEGERVDVGYRLDLLVDGAAIVEVKAIAKLAPIFEVQLLTYLRFSELRVGLLINFHELHLKDGIRRVANSGRAR
jgi:GxxExxY protein